MGKIEQVDTCLGASILKIEVAVSLLQPPPLKLENYEVFLVLENNVEIVLFKCLPDAQGENVHLGVQTEFKMKLDETQVAETIGEMDQMQVLDRVSGRGLHLIEKALPVFMERHKANLLDYKIIVAKKDSSEVVIFQDKDRSSTSRGHNSIHPGFEVEIDTKELTILRANFLR